MIENGLLRHQVLGVASERPQSGSRCTDFVEIVA